MQPVGSDSPSGSLGIISLAALALIASLLVLADLVFVLILGVELVALPVVLGLALAPRADNPPTPKLS